jgi:hypothetical protein
MRHTDLETFSNTVGPRDTSITRDTSTLRAAAAFDITGAVQSMMLHQRATRTTGVQELEISPYRGRCRLEQGARGWHIS